MATFSREEQEELYSAYELLYSPKSTQPAYFPTLNGFYDLYDAFDTLRLEWRVETPEYVISREPLERRVFKCPRCDAFFCKIKLEYWIFDRERYPESVTMMYNNSNGEQTIEHFYFFKKYYDSCLLNIYRMQPHGYACCGQRFFVYLHYVRRWYSPADNDLIAYTFMSRAQTIQTPHFATSIAHNFNYEFNWYRFFASRILQGLFSMVRVRDLHKMTFPVMNDILKRSGYLESPRYKRLLWHFFQVGPAGFDIHLPYETTQAERGRITTFLFAESKPDLKRLLLEQGIEPNPGPTFDEYHGVQTHENNKRDSHTRKTYPIGYHKTRLIKSKMAKKDDINYAQRAAEKQIVQNRKQYNNRKTIEKLMKDLEISPQSYTAEFIDKANEAIADDLADVQDLINEIVALVPAEHLYKIRLTVKIILLYQATSTTQLLTLITDTILSQDSALAVDSVVLFALGKAVIKIYRYIKYKIYELKQDESEEAIVAPQSYATDQFKYLDASSIAGTVSALAACFAGIVCIGKMPDSRSIDMFLSRCHTLPRAFKSIHEVFTYFKRQFMEYIQDNFPSMASALSGSSDNQKLRSFSDRLVRLTEDVTKDGAVFDTNLLARTRAMFTEYCQMLRDADKARNVEFYRRISSFYPIVIKNYSLMQSSPASGATFRQEPCAIQVIGPPNIGKSALTRILATHCLKECGISYEDLKTYGPNAYIYNRATGQPYWTNYDASKHAICIIDDANQIQLMYNQGLPFPGEFINIKNSAPAPVNVAECELKKYAYFNSKVIILSDNEGYPEVSKVVRSPEAYDRRMDFKLKCTKISDQIDYVNYTHIKFDVDMMDIEKKKFRRLENVTLQELLPLIHARIKAYNTIFKETGQDMTEILKQYYEEFQEKPFTMADPVENCQPSTSAESVALLNSQQEIVESLNEQVKATGESESEQVANVTPHFFGWSRVPPPPPDQLAFDTISTAVDFANRFRRESRERNFPSEPPPRRTFWQVMSLFVMWFVNEFKVMKLLFLESRFSCVTMLFKVKFLLFIIYYRTIRRECYVLVLSRLLHQSFDVRNILSRSRKIAFYGLAITTAVSTIAIALHHYFKRKRAEQAIAPQSYSNTPRTYYKGTKNVVTVSTKLRATANVKPEMLAESFDIPIARCADVEKQEISFTHLAQPINAVDSNADEIIHSKIIRNTYVIEYGYFDERERPKSLINHMCVLTGKIGFVTWHFIEAVRAHHEYQHTLKTQGEYLRISRPPDVDNASNVIYNIDIEDFLTYARTWRHPDSIVDCALVYLGVSLPTHCDISKYMLTEGEFQKFNAVYVKRVSINFSRSRLKHEFVIGKTIYEYLQSNSYPLKFDTQLCVLMSDFFLYQAPNSPGLCASPIIALDPKTPRKLVGFHIGDFGDKSSSVACHITREVVATYRDFLIQQFPKAAGVRLQVCLSESALLKPPQKNSVFEDEPVFQVATYDYKAVIPKQTRISPSPIYGQLTKPKTAPARLRNFRDENGVEVNVLKKSVSKQFNTSCHIDKKFLEVAKTEAEHIFNYLFGSEKPRLLTHDEILCGGLPGLNPIPRSTSPGYPYLGQSRKGSGKHPWLGTGEEWIKDDKFLLSEVEKYEQAAQNFERTIQPYTVQLKDETRDLERVRLGKTRTFTASNLTLTYLFRKYFGIIGAKSLVRGKYIGMLPGFNYHGSDTNVIVNYCRKKSPLTEPNFCAGDYTNYDGTLNERVLSIILDVWISKLDLTPEQLNIASMLTIDIFNAMLLIDDQIIQNSHSLPSGCSLTTVLNTWYNKVLASMTMYGLVEKHAPQCLTRYNQLYGLLAYGDDNIFIIHPELRSVIKPEMITEQMKVFGMTYTSGDKHGEIVYQDFSQVKILKRSFVFNESLCRWTMPLDLDVITEVLQWDRKKNEHEKLDQLKMNLDFLSLELVYHGKKKWEEIMDEAIALISQKIPDLPRYTYHSALGHANLNDEINEGPHTHGLSEAELFSSSGLQ